jgi:predicted solute-binding protein
VHYTAGRGGAGAMPSSEYFRRQANICLRLSLVASDQVVSTLLIAMAQDYHAQADALEARSRSGEPKTISEDCNQIDS